MVRDTYNMHVGGAERTKAVMHDILGLTYNQERSDFQQFLTFRDATKIEDYLKEIGVEIDGDS